jgi:hypothetical protein
LFKTVYYVTKESCVHKKILQERRGDAVTAFVRLKADKIEKLLNEKMRRQD